MLTELISRHQTIGHEILDLEAELGIDTGPHKETLDRLIEEARAGITVKDSYTKKDALCILRAINSILQNNGFENRDKEGRIDELNLFHEGLSSKKIDCDNSSFIYLSIAEALNLPLAAVYAPKHVFVRFILGGKRLNWETTSARERSDNNYKSRHNISDESIRNGAYLRDLTMQETMAIAYNNRGIAWANKGNLDNAISDYDKAIRLNPNYAEACNNRGIAWANKGNLDEAIKNFNDAIRLNPNLAEAYNNRGGAWVDKGNLDEAIKNFNDAIRLNPNLAGAYYNRGGAWVDKGNLDEAIKNFNDAIRLNPNLAEAYTYRGIAWANKGNLDKAIADYNEAIRLNHSYAIAYNHRGIAWTGKGRLDEAIKNFNDAIRLNPNLAGAYYNRGIARLKKYQYVGALLDFARAKLPILR